MYFIFLIVVVAVVTVFSIQNSAPVSLSFLFWKFDASLAIVVFLSVLCGIAVMGSVTLSRKVKKTLKASPATKPSGAVKG